MKIAIFGTGYVGLITGVCLAKNGKKVYCIDKDIAKINSIKKCIPPIYESELKQRGLINAFIHNFISLIFIMSDKRNRKHSQVKL